MSWNPCHDCIPVLTSSSAPALHIPGGTAEERGRERKAHRPAGGASWPSLAQLEGEGAVELGRQMPSPPGGPLKSLCCQAGQGVCSGSLPPQPPPATRLGCPSWVRAPGEPGVSSPDASLWLSSLFSPFFLFCFSPFSRFTSLSVSPMFFLFLSPSLSLILSCIYLFLSFMPFLCISFCQSPFLLPHFLFCFSFYFLSASFCLALNPEIAATQGQECPPLYLGKGGRCPSEGTNGAHFQ